MKPLVLKHQLQNLPLTPKIKRICRNPIPNEENCMGNRDTDKDILLDFDSDNTLRINKNQASDSDDSFDELIKHKEIRSKKKSKFADLDKLLKDAKQSKKKQRLYDKIDENIFSRTVAVEEKSLNEKKASLGLNDEQDKIIETKIIEFLGKRLKAKENDVKSLLASVGVPDAMFQCINMNSITRTITIGEQIADCNVGPSEQKSDLEILKKVYNQVTNLDQRLRMQIFPILVLMMMHHNMDHLFIILHDILVAFKPTTEEWISLKELLKDWIWSNQFISILELFRPMKLLNLVLNYNGNLKQFMAGLSFKNYQKEYWKLRMLRILLLSGQPHSTKSIREELKIMHDRIDDRLGMYLDRSAVKEELLKLVVVLDLNKVVSKV